jgi:hypothetical protein
MPNTKQLETLLLTQWITPHEMNKITKMIFFYILDIIWIIKSKRGERLPSRMFMSGLSVPNVVLSRVKGSGKGTRINKCSLLLRIMRFRYNTTLPGYSLILRCFSIFLWIHAVSLSERVLVSYRPGVRAVCVCVCFLFELSPFV